MRKESVKYCNISYAEITGVVFNGQEGSCVCLGWL